jgi:hypothetical protein
MLKFNWINNNFCEHDLVIFKSLININRLNQIIIIIIRIPLLLDSKKQHYNFRPSHHYDDNLVVITNGNVYNQLVVIILSLGERDIQVDKPSKYKKFGFELGLN